MGSLPHIVEDCMGFIQVYSDGTIHRHHVSFPSSAAIVDDTSVAFNDVIFNPKLGLSLRLYRPKSAAAAAVEGAASRLPVVFYFHGGGFCVGSCLWPICHGCCLRLTSGLEAVVVAPDYRLAPEHRLPAAIDDAGRALEWLAAAVAAGSEADAADKYSSCDTGKNEKEKESEDIKWLSKTVDLDRVFVMGDSSGGNMAHHLAVRLGSGSVRFESVRVRGFVMLAPFFGGVVRTNSEEGPSETVLTLEALDRFWRLSMPEGETRDHPFANPFGPNSPNLEKVNLDPILAIVGGKELLKDRVENYAKKLKEMGKNIEYVEFEDEEHGFLTQDPNSDTSTQLLLLIKNFMLENSK